MYVNVFRYVGRILHTLCLLQGCAVILPTYAPDTDLSKLSLSPTENAGQPIKQLVSAPTMRVPANVSKTANAYLAFRAVLHAGTVWLCLWNAQTRLHAVSTYHMYTVLDYNQNHETDKIQTVLCPGLGTAVGRMPYMRCAIQVIYHFWHQYY